MHLFYLLAMVSGGEDLTGKWYGAIEIPGQELQVVITLSYEEEKLKGDISIPSQGLSGRKLRCKYKKGKVTLAITGIPGDPLFKGKVDGSVFSGDFTQGAGSFPFKLEKGKKPGSPSGDETALTAAVADHPALGHWEGHIVIPGQPPLATLIDFRFQNDIYQGRAKFPSQGEQYYPITQIDFNEDQLSFKITSLGGVPHFKGTMKDGIIKGSFQQGSLNTTFELSREPVEGLKRPQMPKEPFPYKMEDFSWKNGEITLAGTLTLPEGPGPFPAVILLTGSGTQDRDSTIFGHKPFWVIADDLSRRGMAVLRYDDRGIGGSTPAPQSTTADFAGDAIIGVKQLAAHPQIDSKRIGLIGHSEGGIIAPLAASQSPDIAFMVSLAGTGIPGRGILNYQLSRKLEVLYQEDKRESFRTWMEQVLDISSKAEKPSEALKQAKPLIAQMHDALPDAIKGQFTPGDYQQSLALLFHPWTAWFMNHDPADTLKTLDIPVLVMLCELDTQVTVAQNLKPIQTALANNPRADIRVMKKLNHLFQPAVTGEGIEYGAIETTFDEQALKALGDWILMQTKK